MATASTTAPTSAPAAAVTPPTELRLSADKTNLRVVFGGGQTYTLTAELLRTHSPSAEVKGHGPGQEKLVAGKKGLTITGLTPVGHYAVQITFADGHASGLYTWGYLAELGENQFTLWEAYTAALQAAGLSREGAQ